MSWKGKYDPSDQATILLCSMVNFCSFCSHYWQFWQWTEIRLEMQLCSPISGKPQLIYSRSGSGYWLIVPLLLGSKTSQPRSPHMVQQTSALQRCKIILQLQSQHGSHGIYSYKTFLRLTTAKLRLLKWSCLKNLVNIFFVTQKRHLKYVTF